MNHQTGSGDSNIEGGNAEHGILPDQLLEPEAGGLTARSLSPLELDAPFDAASEATSVDAEAATNPFAATAAVEPVAADVVPSIEAWVASNTGTAAAEPVSPEAVTLTAQDAPLPEPTVSVEAAGEAAGESTQVEANQDFAALMAAFPGSEEWGDGDALWGCTNNLTWGLKHSGEIGVYIDQDERQILIAKVPHNAPLTVEFGDQGEAAVRPYHYALLCRALDAVRIGARQVLMPDKYRTLWDMMQLTEFEPFYICDEIFVANGQTLWHVLHPTPAEMATPVEMAAPTGDVNA